MKYTTHQNHELTQEMGIMYMALDAVTKFMAKWLDDNLKKMSSDYWDHYVIAALYDAQRKTLSDNGAKTLYDLDQPTLLSVFLQNKTVLVGKLGVDQQLFGYAHGIKDIRNKYFHKNSKPLAKNRFKHDLETLVLFLDGLGASEDIVNGVKDLFGKMASPVPMPTQIADHAPAGKRDIRIFDSAADNTGREKVMQENPEVNEEIKNTVLAVPPENGQRDYRPDVLYESIQNCLKVDFNEYKFGTCTFYRQGDPCPTFLEEDVEWEWAIVLQIFEADKQRIANEISSFNWIVRKYHDIESYVKGDCAVWRLPAPRQTQSGSGAAEIATTVFLPKWYAEAIAAVNGVAYETDRLGVRQTLQSSNEARRLYLGTYAPRSCAEMLAIADYTFTAHPEILKSLGDEIHILDIGSGSGAATMGLIWSLKKKRLHDVRKVVVYAVDGNASALSLFEELLPQLKEAWKSVSFELKVKHVSSVDEIVLSCGEQVDFVVSSKFLQELQSEKVLSRIVAAVNKVLKPTGISFWIANPGIDRTTDEYMGSPARYNEVLLLRPSLKIRVWGIPRHNEIVEESVSCRVQFRIESVKRR